MLVLMGAHNGKHRYTDSRRDSDKPVDNRERNGRNSIRSEYIKDEKRKISDQRIVIEDEAPVFVTEEEKKMLKTCWESLQKDISKVGVVTFMKLFETHPDVQDAFLPFRGLSTTDMEQSAILRAHALRVMMTVDKCLNRIETPSKIEHLMMELGRRHVSYSVKIEFIDMMGEQFIYAIKTNLGDQWSPELEKAWWTLFNMIKYYMRRGFNESNKE